MSLNIKISTIDSWFSRYIRLSAENKCEFCGKDTGKLDCSHFFGRRVRAVRHDPDNACCACFGCHQYLDEHPNVHVDFFRKRLGSERFEALCTRSNLPPPKPKTVKARLDWLKQAVKKLEAAG